MALIALSHSKMLKFMIKSKHSDLMRVGSAATFFIDSSRAVNSSRIPRSWRRNPKNKNNTFEFSNSLHFKYDHEKSEQV
uniref:Ovule protein n=1 Tax=Strongyloides venezuelensis TaxID=75913 RepID=A0A0K0G5J8_STRVS